MNIGHTRYDEYKSSDNVKPKKGESFRCEATKKIADSFKELHTKIALNHALYSGSPCIGSLFNTKSKVIGAPAQDVVQEMKSYIKNRMRQPYCYSNNSEFSEEAIGFLNELIVNIYSQNNIEKTIMDTWVDYMVSGVGIMKIEPSINDFINHENVPQTNCAWDVSNHKKPQFFLHEEILSNNTIVQRYGIDEIEYESILGKRSAPLISLETINFGNKFTEFFTSGKGSKIKSDRINSVYSKDFKSMMVREFPGVGFSVVRHEYYINNVKIDGEVKQVYRKFIFLNDVIIKNDETLLVEEFPYVFISEVCNKHNVMDRKYPSFMDKVQDIVLKYNYMSNLQLDELTASALGANKVFLNAGCITDGKNKEHSSIEGVTSVYLTPDVKINEVLYTTSPSVTSIDYERSIEQCKLRIRASSGLINFDINNLNSGEQEKVRLDREFVNISNWLTGLDDCIITIGNKLYNIVKHLCSVDSSKLHQYTNNVDGVSDLGNVIEKMDEIGISIVVKERKTLEDYKQVVISDFQSLKELTGDAFNVPTVVIAKALGMSPQTIELISNFNAPSEEEQELMKVNIEKAKAELEKIKSDIDNNNRMIDIEVEKAKASIEKDKAMAKKYIAESKEVEVKD